MSLGFLVIRMRQNGYENLVIILRIYFIYILLRMFLFRNKIFSKLHD